MIYLDNASTTKMTKEALDAFVLCANNDYYNPSSPHKAGFKNSLLLCQMRDKVKSLLGIKPIDNLYFCSGATEANNTIIRSAIKPGSKIAVSVGEHPSVLNVCKDLQNHGIEVFYIGLTPNGTIDTDELVKVMSENLIDFVSVMTVSNETGAINDIQKIVKMVKAINPKCLVHTDGTQAVGKIPVNVQAMGVDYFTLSGHKFGGPKGVGAYFVKKNAPYKPLLLGGGQELGARSGTENMPAIVSMTTALENAIENLQANFEKVKGFNDFICDYFKDDEQIILNTSIDNSPYILSMIITGLKGEVLVHFLEQEDILVGTGSACSSKKSGNATLQAMGFKRDQIVGSLRLSFSPQNTMEEIKNACVKLGMIIIKQRELK